MKKPIHALYVDSDPFLYLAAHKAQPKCYWVGTADLNTKAEAIEYANTWAPELINDLRKEEFLCSPSQARQYLHECVDKSVDVYVNWFNKNLAKRYDLNIIYSISSKTSFRKDLYPDYKGTRPEKPRWYELLREYFIDYYVPVIEEGMEADDVVAKLHYETYKTDSDASCIASIDKDLYNIPGLHYNPGKYKVNDIHPMEGIYSFCTQLLTGDATDNIKGPKGIGPKTAEKLLGDTHFNSKGPRTYFIDTFKTVIIPEYTKAFGEEAMKKAAINFKLLDVGQVYEKQFSLTSLDKVLGL